MVIFNVKMAIENREKGYSMGTINVQETNTKDNVRVVTSNYLITTDGLSDLSIKARKLLLLAIAQCKMCDKEFYCYRISIKDFSELIGVDTTGLYKTIDKITEELVVTRVTIKYKNRIEKYPLFVRCAYEKNKHIEFLLNPYLADTLLSLKQDFSKPLLRDFMRMKSLYSLQIWHLMQREMKSKKPNFTSTIEFDLTLDALRQVTGTQNKAVYNAIGNFKNKILDKALKEIEENCCVKISYENIKHGRTIVGFHFTAINSLHIDITEIPDYKLAQIEDFKNRRKKE